jgi:hypothetical protein
MHTKTVTHRKWVKVADTPAYRQAVEETTAEPNSPVGVLLGVYGAAKVVLHFEDGGEESWEVTS